MVLPVHLCSLDIFGLCAFIAADEQQYQHRAIFGAVDPVARTEIDLELQDAFPYWLTLTEVPCFNPIQANLNSCATSRVTEIIEPIIKRG